MKTKSIKTKVVYALRISGSWILLVLFTIVFQRCQNTNTASKKQMTATDSTAYQDSVATINDSIYSLTGETQINIAGATISGNVFYNAIQHIDLLFFVYPKNVSNFYSVTCATINSGAITSVSLNGSSNQTIPASPSPNQFTARPEKISITDLNQFISDLISMDGIDLKNNGANYWVNIMPDPTIQHDAIGYYFDIYISASSKSNPSVQSTARAKVHPCPPCN